MTSANQYTTYRDSSYPGGSVVLFKDGRFSHRSCEEVDSGYGRGTEYEIYTFSNGTYKLSGDSLVFNVASKYKTLYAEDGEVFDKQENPVTYETFYQHYSFEYLGAHYKIE